MVLICKLLCKGVAQISLTRYAVWVVKKQEKRAMPESAREIARAIKGLMAEKNVTQIQIAEVIERTQGYVSERVNGIDAWNTAELERVARRLGFVDAFELLAEVQKRR